MFSATGKTISVTFSKIFLINSRHANASLLPQTRNSRLFYSILVWMGHLDLKSGNMSHIELEYGKWAFKQSPTEASRG